MKECFGIIYKVTNKINGNVYIGQTMHSLKKRRSKHESNARMRKIEKSYFYKAIRKYGKENFDWDILEYCNSKYELDLAEEWYIRYYRTFIRFNVCNGYNLTMGGEGSAGRVVSEKTKQKISKSKFGIALSKEAIQAMSVRLRGKKKTKEHVENVVAAKSQYWLVIFPSGQEKIIKNLSQFCRDFNLNSGAMYMVSWGQRNQHKGFKCKKIDKKLNE